MEFWEKHFCLFVWGSLVLGFLCTFLSYYFHKRNNLVKDGKSKPYYIIRRWVFGVVKKICPFLQRPCDSPFEEENQRSGESSKEQKYLPWYTEILPFVLACIASIILPNLLFVIAEKVKIAFPSPLNYENTFLLVVPLAWTVGIAFFQYRIQDKLTLLQQKEKDMQNKQEKLQQQELRKGELISALRSLYSCNLSAINFCTPKVSPLSKREFRFVPQSDLNSGYAFEIINKSGDPCFYFPYYKVDPDPSAKNITLEMEDHTVKDNYYSISPNEAYIFIPSNLDDFFSKPNTEINEAIRLFFVSPALGRNLQQNQLKFVITVDAEDPFYISNGVSGTRSLPIKYKICFYLKPYGGYSSEECFPLKITNYTIEMLEPKDQNP